MTGRRPVGAPERERLCSGTAHRYNPPHYPGRLCECGRFQEWPDPLAIPKPYPRPLPPLSAWERFVTVHPRTSWFFVGFTAAMFGGLVYAMVAGLRVP